MAIRLICVCGRGMALPEKYAGQHVQCPDCRAMLRIPTSEENLALTRWICKCGQRLKARPRTGGRKLRCPKCSLEVAVPFADGHSTFVEENFLLNDASGVVEHVREMPREEAETAIPAPPPPPVKNLLATSAPDRGGPKAPAPKTRLAPPEPPLVLDGDDEETTIHSRGPVPLADLRSTQAKDKPDSGYEVEVEPQPAPAPRPQPARPAKPAAVAPQPVEEESWAQDAEEEGINAPELTVYFNTKTGAEAARAGVLQVLHGYWLYIPYALLAACMFNVTQMALRATEGNSAAVVLWLALPGLFSLFLWAGFVACVKDGVFERSMGIERMFYNAGVHFVRFGLTALMMVPVGVALALAATAVIAKAWGPSPFVVRIAIVALTFAAGLFAMALLLMSPVISVLEHREPFSSLGRGLVFSFRHFWSLFTITLVSMFVGWGFTGLAYLAWWLSRMLLQVALPAWIFDSLVQFFGGLASAAIMGQLVASLMLLYLSHVGDEERLQEIQNRLRGPAAAPVRLYSAIGAAAITLLTLNYFRAPQEPAGIAQDMIAPAAAQPAPGDVSAPPANP